MANEKYYIEDASIYGYYDEPENKTEEMTKEEFTESLNYNIEIAFVYGDGGSGRDFETFKKDILKELEYYGSVEVNGFTYSVVIN